MTDLAPVDGHQRIVRLVRKGNRYRDLGDTAYIDGDWPLDAGVSHYLRTSCYLVDAEIEVDGATIPGAVYVPRSQPAVGYALVESSMIGALRASATAGVESGIATHVRTLRQAVSQYDSLGARRSVDLRHTYVRPRLQMRRAAGSAQAVAWEGLPALHHAVIFGSAGAGKTSVLRRLALAVSDSLVASPDMGTVPVYLQLRQFAGRTIDVDSLHRHIAASGGEPLAGRFDELARSGRLLLLIDGLDEVVDTNRPALARSISRLRDLHPSMRILVTSRVLGYGGELDDFAHVDILPFSREQIYEWAWLSNPDEEVWRLFLRQLSENVDIEAAVANPLLLSLAMLLFEGSAAGPRQRSVLFDYFVRALIDEWDRDRGVHRTVRRANHRAVYSSLCRFSYMCAAEDRQTFDIADVQRWSSRWSSASRRGRTESDLDVEALAETSALLSKVDERSWAFIHVSFRDFLAAEYVVASSGETTEYLGGKLYDQHGRAVWALASGAALDATPLLRLVLESELLSRQEGAVLLIDALRQGVEADDDIVRLCVERIAGVVEAGMPSVGARAVTPTAPSEGSLLEFSCTERLAAGEVVPLARAIEALASARDAEWAPLLFARLRRSAVSEVRVLASALAEGLPRGAWIRATAIDDAIVVSAEMPQSPGASVRKLLARLKHQ